MITDIKYWLQLIIPPQHPAHGASNVKHRKTYDERKKEAIPPPGRLSQYGYDMFDKKLSL